jgi:hypothetical protein
VSHTWDQFVATAVNHRQATTKDRTGKSCSTFAGC